MSARSHEAPATCRFAVRGNSMCCKRGKTRSGAYCVFLGRIKVVAPGGDQLSLESKKVAKKTWGLPMAPTPLTA